VAGPAPGRELAPQFFIFARVSRRRSVKTIRRQKDLFHVALLEPEIPPNTGNIARLCVATGAELHLIGRLGFRLDDRSLRRAGLDYWDALRVHRHVSLAAFEAECASSRLLCLSARAVTPYTAARFSDGDYLLFGGESHGLPQSVIDRHGASTFLIPMPAGKVRSLNLATAVGIVLYEALRQTGAW
jgi:tRNA (cytidine/uridine-2'-O-)-methyltransferase